MMEFIKSIKKDKRVFRVAKIIVAVIGIIIILLGGVEMLAITIISLSSFILGIYTNKIITFIKDYRLSKKIERIEYDKVKFEALKEENKRLNEILRATKSTPQGGFYPPAGGGPGRMNRKNEYYDFDEEYEY